MKSAELERDAMKCLLLAQEVPDPRQRQILEEFGVALLHVAEQVKESRHQDASDARPSRGRGSEFSAVFTRSRPGRASNKARDSNG
jgi:hypothetical protein